jgi:hypothetical protein
VSNVQSNQELLGLNSENMATQKRKKRAKLSFNGNLALKKQHVDDDSASLLFSPKKRIKKTATNHLHNVQQRLTTTSPATTTIATTIARSKL